VRFASERGEEWSAVQKFEPYQDAQNVPCTRTAARSILRQTRTAKNRRSEKADQVTVRSTTKDPGTQYLTGKPALRMLLTDGQCFGMAHPGAARTSSITVGDSLRVQPELLRLLMTRTANDHVEKHQPILLTEDSVFSACGYFVAMLANEFHSSSRWSKPHTQKKLSVKLPQMTQFHRIP
jgi:hypothetical protein